ncbi:condensation domain-containing protein, partial [Flavobacterium sp. H122]|uniref:condensation domain-containing protein n=1 Tax=Flavobacterium sp. H122 TaxID=2529860 RepID=UPI001B7D8503
EDILSISPIGVTDNFFELGGDSIIAIRLLGRINKELNWNYKLSDLYHYPSIRLLLSIQESRIQDKDLNAIKNKIEEEFDRLYEQENTDPNIVAVFPMSDIEMGMVYESLSNPKLGIYHDQFIFPIPVENFDLQLFTEAVSLLVNKHEILRTKFDMESYDEAVHVVFEKLEKVIDFEDISHKNKEEIYSLVNQFMVKERIENPFDIASSDLWRMKVIKTGQKEWHLLFQFHHAILDGWSVASFITELNTLYSELESNTKIDSLSKLSSSYKDYVIEQKINKESTEINAFWKENLLDYKKLEAFNEVHFSKRHNYIISNELSESLLNFGQLKGYSIKTITLAAYIYTLKMLSYNSDILIGLVTNGRPLLEDSDKILGCFLNTTPFRIKDFDHTYLTFVNHIHNALISQKDFENISLYDLSKQFSNNVRGENPFFDTHFNFIDFHIYDQIGIDDPYSVNDDSFLTKLNYETTNTFLDLTIRPLKEGISVSWNQQRTLKYNQVIDVLHDYFTAFLNKLVENPDSLIKNDEILPESKYLLEGLNSTNIVYPSDVTVLDL